MFLYLILLIAASYCADTCPYTYDLDGATEDGPAVWGTMCDGEYSDCTLDSQSPIDIVTGDVVDFEQTFETSVINFESIQGYIVNNGHTCQFTPYYTTAKLGFAGIEFPWIQFHHHVPSEHEIDGELMGLEIHFVHYNENGDVAVIGVLFDDFDDTVVVENPFLAQFEDFLPGVEGGYSDPIDINFRLLLDDITDLDSFYNYNGSFTTPPCTEGVNWFVYSTVLEATSAQIELFNLFYVDVDEPGNNRPVLALNGRTVGTVDAVPTGGDYYDDRLTYLETGMTEIVAGLAELEVELEPLSELNLVEMSADLALVTAMLGSTCDGKTLADPNACSGNGICLHSECYCTDGYGGDDCSEVSEVITDEIKGSGIAIAGIIIACLGLGAVVIICCGMTIIALIVAVAAVAAVVMMKKKSGGGKKDMEPIPESPTSGDAELDDVDAKVESDNETGDDAPDEV